MRCWYDDILYDIGMNIINKTTTSEFSTTHCKYRAATAAETCFSLSGLSNSANKHYSHYSYQSCQIRTEVT